MKKISILTPSYNSGKYLERAIESVISQEYTNVEHIVVDGGSTDHTIDILKSYPHVKWITEPDKGQSDAMNKAFNLSTGEVISYLNADDWYEPGAFNEINEVFSQLEAPLFVVGNFFMQRDNKKVLYSPVSTYRKLILHYKYPFPFNPVAYFYSREIQEKIGQFPTDNHFTMDYWFLLEVYRKFSSKIVKIKYPLGTFLQDGDNKTSTIDPVALCSATLRQHLVSYKDFPRLLLYNINLFLDRKSLKFL
jgi:glycosyltransferase involved in cell wall biosynthesis